jgi:hypothetical protein
MDEADWAEVSSAREPIARGQGMPLLALAIEDGKPSSGAPDWRTFRHESDRVHGPRRTTVAVEMDLEM